MRFASRWIRTAAAGSVACVVAVVAAAFAPAHAGPGARYVVGVVPSFPPLTMHAAWSPFVERLSRETGFELTLKVYENMPDFEADFRAGRTDFIFANPVQAMQAHKAQGYIPLVRGNRKIASVLFVAGDSPVREVKDLAGKDIAFVGPKNICSVLMRQRLSQGEFEKLNFKPRMTGSASNVLKSVQIGKADAGALLEGDFNQQSAASGGGFREILTTAPIAPHPLSAHPRVPPAVREVVTEAVLRLAGESDGTGLLSAVRLALPERADYDRDYRDLERIDLESLIPDR